MTETDAQMLKLCRRLNLDVILEIVNSIAHDPERVVYMRFRNGKLRQKISLPVKFDSTTISHKYTASSFPGK